MPWKTIRKGGIIYPKSHLSRLGGVDGLPQVRKFFEGFTKAFIEVCAKYHKVVNNLPIEGERQTQSAVLPAIYKVADAVSVELPMPKRKTGDQEKLGAGRIDYWVYFGDFVFLIEFKVCWLYLNGSIQLPPGILYAWSKSLQQLDQVRKEDAQSQAMYPDKALKIALLMVPSYQWADDAETLRPFNEMELNQVHRKLLANLSLVAAPDWHCIWQPHDTLRLFQYPGDGTWEAYPYLGLFAKVMPI